MQNKKIVVKKKGSIDFTGLSVKDLGIVINKKIKPTIGDSNMGDSKLSGTKNSTAKLIVTKNDDTKITATQNKSVLVKDTKTPRRNLHLNTIRDALNKALGDNERVEIKLGEMQRDLDISENTFYRHLKTLRNTEFDIVKLRYCSELQRKQGRG